MKKVLNKDEFMKVIKEEVKRQILDKSSKATNIKEDVMSRFFGIKSNGHKPMMVEHITIDRIMNKHGKNGFVIVSANRSDRQEDENLRNTQSLIADIKASGFSYLPTYGGYRGSDGVEDDYEPSFIVFNYDENGRPQDFNVLRKFAIDICGKYQQDSVLIKDPENPPIYVDNKGEKVNSTESDAYWENDPAKEYFTSMKPKDGTTDRRFTMDINFEESAKRNGVLLNPPPCTLNERMRRKNEIFLF